MHRSGIEPPTLAKTRAVRCLPLVLVVGSLLGCLSREQPPNVVLFVVDTLRADHLGAYGYPRETSPSIDRHFAEGGVTFERAYAQAPWTIPSMSSLLTGLEPAALLDDEGQPWGIPLGAATLAEELAAAGYETAAFVANPTLHEGNGFDQGFRHFRTAPFELASFDLHGDWLADQVLAWLERRPARPFLLYVHLLDPHDPYVNDDIHEGATPFDPDYRGNLGGGDVHGLYLGQRELEGPADLRHLRALYDMEVRFVDRQVGRLVDALDPRLGETLFVLTADHGEELFDHGGFKHGDTVFDELTRVPLFLRWDGRLPAGRRVATTVQLLDLFPTLLAAVGRAPAGRLAGVDLLAPLRDGREPPERPVISRHFSTGPLRTAVVWRGRKLVLFDRQAPFAPPDDRAANLWRRDLARLDRRAVYDLASDPGETAGLENVDARWLGQAEEALLRSLDRGLEEGLRLVATDLPPGSSLEGLVRATTSSPSPARARSLFLEEGDLLREEAGTIRFALRGGGGMKWIQIATGEDAELEVRVELDEEAFEPTLASGRKVRVVRTRELAAPPPSRPEGPALRIWYGRGLVAQEGAERDEETLRRLRALGYLD